ncbi:hypothetical protein ACW0JT_06430 [Arthrobacter sp. SA17]
MSIDADPRQEPLGDEGFWTALDWQRYEYRESGDHPSSVAADHA